MEKINDKLFAIISFCIFLISIFKYYFINVLEILHPYGKDNRLISWFLLPIIFIGLFFSILVLFKNAFSMNKNKFNIALALPLIVFVVYFFFLKGICLK